ncbi:EthD family reductase [Nonomuraea rhizosphaerae]|uniref:EthD family reductase n=1 Tax=Nonomuraea rhizosphaerae TaxID=2665663 RepID=UPI001C603BF8|nr:EthD family reductase [Nonomuraea rhizosphaerae]
MAYQLIVLYNPPESVTAFDKHYDETHAPLAAELPGLRAYTATRPGPSADGGSAPYHLVAILTWDDEAAFNAAMASEAGQAAVADLANFAGAGVTVLSGPSESAL